MAAQLSSGARVDPLAVIRAHAESHRSRAESDAYSAQEAPKLEAAIDAVAELVAAAHRAEVSFNTVRGCYERNPGNFMVAMRELEADVLPLRTALAPFSEAGR